MLNLLQIMRGGLLIQDIMSQSKNFLVAVSAISHHLALTPLIHSFCKTLKPSRVSSSLRYIWLTSLTNLLRIPVFLTYGLYTQFHIRNSSIFKNVVTIQ